MASESSASSVTYTGGNIEVFPWLKTLPVAPEYHPTLAEFQDPIAYIFKIEKEASNFGICKIVPPIPPPPKKTSIVNLNKSLSARSGSGPTFTTRQQQIGFCPRKHRPVQKPVWQSGEDYTVAEFEVKAKGFEKNYLKKCSKKNLTPLEIETLYWKATVDKPFSVEYANDMPGSAFAPKRSGKGGSGEGSINSNVNVGGTEWNMRGVSRSKGSLLRFMKEEIPGVTSPMVYIAMMFSWFAWHVEDHDLHSLNYLHMGAGKTWYGVPRDAAVAFEEVIRVHGYGGEINPIVTFATLGEKTTVMSPEVLIEAGVPCCRLVQNPGEFVVTFPRAYHSGFSHGFNCGEASNIATPEWLRLAKDAAIRRASTNCPPMVSHYQLLYDLALTFSSRVPKNIHLEPRSSRLKDKKKGEGELLVKDLFVQDVMQNNGLLHMLADGSSVVILPRNSLGTSVCSNLEAGSRFQLQARKFSAIGSPDLAMRTKTSVYDLERKKGIQPGIGAYSREKFTPSDNRLSCSERGTDAVALSSQAKTVETEGERDSRSDRLSEQGLFSCVTCGILCFACVAIIQPTDAAASYLTTADCSMFKDWEETSDAFTNAAVSGDENSPESAFRQGRMRQRNADGLFDVPVQSADQIELTDDESAEEVSDGETQKGTSSLGLLALAYGNSSDSEEDLAEADVHTDYTDGLPRNLLEGDKAGSAGREATSDRDISSLEVDCMSEVPLESISMEQELTGNRFESRSQQSLDWPAKHQTDSFNYIESDNLIDRSRHQFNLQHGTSSCMPLTEKATGVLPFDNTILPFSTRADEDSSRMHVFCLQHAVQVEKQLRSIGGSRILLLCHPDYPKVEDEAKKLAEELGNDHIWSDISFKEASREDEENMRSALESEEAIHGNGDWAVKLGINLYYSANLSRSPLYSKQMPYNFIIYNAFGRSSPASPTKAEFNGKGPGKLKNVAGKWCGKVWMSNQVHPLLAERAHGEAKKTRTPSQVEVDLKPERPSESIWTVETASRICRSSRKRKSKAEIRPASKEKSLKAEEQDKDSDGSSMDCPLQLCKSNLRNKQMIKEKPKPCIRSSRNKKELNIEIEASEDSSMEGPLQQCKSNLRNKRMKKEKPEPCIRSARNQKEQNIETEASDNSSMEGPLQQCKSNMRNARMKKEKPEPRIRSARNKRELIMETEGSEDSSMEGPLQQCKSNLRNKRMKKEKPEPRIRSARNKRELIMEIEDEPNSRNKCVKNKKDLIMEIEDEVLPRNKFGKNKKELNVENEGELKPRNKGARSKRDLNLEDDDNPKTPRMRGTRDKRQLNLVTPKDSEGGPCTRLRKRPSEPSKEQGARSIGARPTVKKQQNNEKAAKKAIAGSKNSKAREEKADFPCDLEGCTMSFCSKQELLLHKRNICPVKGCGKDFFSHKYLVQHRRVHVDDRPLKCPWKGCKMTFKWAWARTEHIRVHTGARPYVCNETGCGQTFRFVSDFSRHKRKTGHVSEKRRRG